MILHGEYRTADVLEALNGAVVQVDIAHAGDLRVNRLAYNGIAVVLRGDVGAVCVDVLYRMVDTAVTVLQLGGLCVDSQCQQLVTEADAEDRHIGLQQLLEVCYDLDILRRVAGGLPFIEKKVYSGKEYSVTEYTMSEIIASIYDKMEETGLKEGILFIDEINCVSETLAPTMLQFLQCKMFGNQKIPEGWIIVAAGNPPEYNKSVRDFDVVTLDRIKKIDVDVNYDVWKEYAYQADIHPAILAYLEIRRDYFYRMETTVDGRVFATARGWEDLSQLLKTYEKLGKKADREVVHQYIQHWKIAKDFANYLELYRKYKKDYGLEKIIEGVYTKDTLERLQYAAFDERLSVVNMLIGRLGTCFKEYFLKDRFVTILYDYLKLYKSNLQIDLVVCEAREKYEKLRKEEQMTKQEDHVRKQVLDTLESYEQLTKEEHLDGEAAFERVKELFGNEVAGRDP